MRLLRERHSSRLRASLRGLLPWVVALLVLVSGSISIGTVFDLTATEYSLGESLAILLGQLLLLAIVAGVAVSTAVRLDRRQYTAFGLDITGEWLRDFGAGVLLTLPATLVVLWVAEFRGMATVSVDISAGSATGGILALSGAFVVILGFLFANVVYEEVVFRGIMLQNFAEGLRARGLSSALAVGLAVVGSLFAFGVSHILFGQGDAVREVATSGMMGIAFTLAYILTGQLGLSIGVHFGGVFLMSTLREEFFGLELPTIVVMEPIANAPVPYELFVVRVLLVSLFVVGWVYVVDDEIRIAETVYRSNLE